MGRPPKPTALKIIEGNRGKRPLPRHEPQPEQLDDLTPPAHLLAEVAEVWVELAPALRRHNLLTQLDRLALEALCSAVATYRLATRELAATGLVVFDPERKRWKRNSWAIVQSQALQRAVPLLGAFGLTPAARSRISAPPPSDDGNLTDRYFT